MNYQLTVKVTYAFFLPIIHILKVYLKLFQLILPSFCDFLDLFWVKKLDSIVYLCFKFWFLNNDQSAISNLE